MRGVVAVFVFLIVVVWDLAQNNGFWIHYVTRQVALTLQQVGIL